MTNILIGATNGVESLQQVQHSLKAVQRAPGISSSAYLVLGEILKGPASDVARFDKSAEAGKVDARQTQQALQDINKVLSDLKIGVLFQFEPNTSNLVIKVVDQETGKVIRQFPSEDVVRISKAMDDLTGLLIGHKV